MRIYLLMIIWFLLPRLASGQDSVSASLDTVFINTGYEKRKPNEVNGAVTVIGTATLDQQTGTNILQRLNNVTSGLQFRIAKSNNNTGSGTNINIRGFGTINGPLDPLIVLDNFIYEGSINNINPNDVENITILKDAAATSIYGARGGNGVIVITTKRGKLNQRTRLSFNSNFITAEKPGLSSIPQISPAEQIDMEIYLFQQGHFDRMVNNRFEPLTPLIAVLADRRNGLISAADSASAVNRFKSNDTRSQYERHFYTQPLTQQYALSLYGGSDKHAWLVSGAYDREHTNLDARNNKINLRVSNTYRPIKALQLDLNVYVTSQNNTLGKPDFQTASRVRSRHVPYLAFVDENGRASEVPLQWRQSYIDTAGDGLLDDWQYRPLEEYKLNVNRSRIEDLVASAGIAYQVLPWLNAQFNYQFQRQLTLQENDASPESYYARDLVNQFAQVDYTSRTVNYIVPKGGILSRRDRRQNSQQGRIQLNADKTFGDHHRLAAFAGAEIRQIISSSSGQVFYGYRKDPLVSIPVDHTNPYPQRPFEFDQHIPGPPELSLENNRFVSLYGNASYTWRDRYHLTGSARRDGSNVFGVESNNRWKPLWSAGAGWTISKEKFYRADWLPYLKLRTSYGKSGNVDLSLSALPIAQYWTNFVSLLPYADIEVINNPHLRWEQVSQWNIGVDFSSRNRRFSGSLDIYRKRGTDLYGEAAYDYTTWGRRGTLVRNVASMKGTGADLQLNALILKGAVQWNALLLYSYNKSVTDEYYADVDRPFISILSDGGTINPIPGQPLYFVGSYRWAGLDATGYPQSYLDGKPSRDWFAISDEIWRKGDSSVGFEMNGSALPTSFGSIVNTFSWNALSLSVNVSYRMGYYFRRPAHSSRAVADGGSGGHPEFAERWRQPGDESRTNVPVFDFPGSFESESLYTGSSLTALRGDHMRLEYVHLAYRWRFAELYLNAANLGIVWKANNAGVDPDYAGRLAPVKTYTAGIRIQL